MISTEKQQRNSRETAEKQQRNSREAFFFCPFFCMSDVMKKNEARYGPYGC
jgi:hypothetical protein